MTNKRIILEIPLSIHEKIKNFAIKDKRTMTTVLRIMVEEMIDKLIDDKEKQHNLVSNKSSSNSKIFYNIEEKREMDQYGRILTDDSSIVVDDISQEELDKMAF